MRGRLEYLIKWKGFTEEHNTWEPASNVDRSPNKVREFYQKHPGAPRLIQANIFKSLPFTTYTNHTITPTLSQITKLDHHTLLPMPINVGSRIFWFCGTHFAYGTVKSISHMPDGGHILQITPDNEDKVIRLPAATVSLVQ